MLSLVLGLGFILLGVLPQGYLSFYLLKKMESQIKTKHTNKHMKNRLVRDKKLKEGLQKEIGKGFYRKLPH
ncbi:hypothetical protein [Myxosarcina sp. GI1(2024)]